MVKLKYTLTVGDGSGNTIQANDTNHIIFNLPAGLTIRQRKMHRACMNYTVTGGYVTDTSNTSRIQFATAFDNWTTRAALKRGRNKWLQMHRDLFKENPQLKPKWHDFKPALLREQMEDGRDYTVQYVPEDVKNRTLPHDDRGQTYSRFVTEDSRPHINSGSQPIVDPNKDEFTCHIVGAHLGDANDTDGYTSIGLVQSWFESRPDINPINTVDEVEMDLIENDPLNMLFNDGDADNEMIENFQNAEENNMAEEGDMFPMYANEPINYKDDGGTFYSHLEEQAVARCTPQNAISYFTGFTALTGQVLGVLKIGSASAGDNIEIVFDVDPRGASI